MRFLDVQLTAEMIDALIADVDRRINRGLSEILHHPDFQDLEARWGGLHLLIHSIPDEDSGLPADGQRPDDPDEVLVSIWNVSKVELFEDMKYSLSRQASATYKNVYDRAFNTAGGEPFGILVGDYTFSDHPNDLSMLRDISAISAASFSPFIAAADPAMFHIERYDELFTLSRSHLREKQESLLVAQFRDAAYAEWNALRQSFNARFLVLALPRFLLRRPYDSRRFLGARAGTTEEDPHPYREPAHGSRNDGLLWGNPAFALAQVILDCFVRSGWLADIHGMPELPNRAGVVPLVERDDFLTDSPDLCPKFATEVLLTDELEKDLSSLGFLALCDRPSSRCAFFGSTPSIHEPAELDGAAAMVSERMSSMLHYMLCVCRFAHYVKQIGHDEVGTSGTAERYQQLLHNYLVQFVLQDENAPPELKARQPLNDVRVQVSPVPGRRGEFHCEIMLKPHHELDAIEVRLETEFQAVTAS